MAVEAGHVDVREHHVGPALAEASQPVLAVDGELHPMALADQDLLGERAVIFVVVDHEDVSHGMPWEVAEDRREAGR